MARVFKAVTGIVVSPLCFAIGVLSKFGLGKYLQCARWGITMMSVWEGVIFVLAHVLIVRLLVVGLVQ